MKFKIVKNYVVSSFTKCSTLFYIFETILDCLVKNLGKVAEKIVSQRHRNSQKKFSVNILTFVYVVYVDTMAVELLGKPTRTPSLFFKNSLDFFSDCIWRILSHSIKTSTPIHGSDGILNYTKKAWNLIMPAPLIEAFELALLHRNEQRRPTLMQKHTDTPTVYRIVTYITLWASIAAMFLMGLKCSKFQLVSNEA